MENKSISLRPFPCSLCSTTFDSRSHLRKHVSNRHNKIIGDLDCCGVRFSDKKALKHHTQSCHSNYQCGVCDKRYNTQNSLNRHQLAHSDYNKFHCNVCEFVTCHKANLKRHVETQHGSGPDEEWHVATKSTLKYKCTRCRRGFQWASSLRQHMKRSHGFKARDKFKCSSCDYTTDRNSHLKRHLKTHESKGESIPINASVESNRRSTEIIYTDASESTEDEDDVGTFSVDHQLRSLRMLLKKKDNGYFPVNEKRCHSREIEGQCEVSQDKAPSDASDSGCEESCYPMTTNHFENVDEMEIISNATIPSCSVEHTPSQRLSVYKSLPLPLLNPIHGEARQLRSHISLATSIPAVLSILERLLELSAIMTNQIRSSDGECSSQTIECFEYLWSTSKMAVCRWEYMEGSKNRNTNLRAVKYAYEILPVFISLEINAHLEMVECVNELVINTVKNCQHH